MLPLPPSALAALRRHYTQRLPEFVAEPPTAAEVRAVRKIHDLWIPWILERRLSARDGLPTA